MGSDTEDEHGSTDGSLTREKAHSSKVDAAGILTKETGSL